MSFKIFNKAFLDIFEMLCKCELAETRRLPFASLLEMRKKIKEAAK